VNWRRFDPRVNSFPHNKINGIDRAGMNTKFEISKNISVRKGFLFDLLINNDLIYSLFWTMPAETSRFHTKETERLCVFQSSKLPDSFKLISYT
jgi:hypothetical protein